MGNLLALYSLVYVCVRFDADALAPVALISPFYWVLMSVAAWRALVSFVVRPHHWNKTHHGISFSARARHAETSVTRMLPETDRLPVVPPGVPVRARPRGPLSTPVESRQVNR